MRSKGDVIRTMVRLLLGGVFLYAGIVKVADPNQFAGEIAAYRILPYFGNYLVATLLPWLEMLCGALLVLGFWAEAAAALILVLTTLFMTALASTLARGLDIDCGCFRHGGEKTSAGAALGRDALLFVAALVVLRKNRKKRGRETL